MKTGIDKEKIEQFRQQLDGHYGWPVLYTFKFILPIDKENALKKLFPNHLSEDKISKNNNYIGITYQMMMPSAEAVAKVYLTAAQIEGIIAL